MKEQQIRLVLLGEDVDIAICRSVSQTQGSIAPAEFGRGEVRLTDISRVIELGFTGKGDGLAQSGDTLTTYGTS